MQNKKFLLKAIPLSVIILSPLSLVGCMSTNETVAKASDNPYRSYIYSETIKKHKPTVDIEEYIARVGKKIILVSDNPEAEYHFKVNQGGTPIEVEKDGTITVSKEALKTLKDEAELAAILAQAINKVNNNFAKTTPTGEDQEVISLIGRAGYDPKAIADVQERAINRTSDGDTSWISNISEHKINHSRVIQSKNAAAKSRKGLQRNKHTYINIVIDS